MRLVGVLVVAVLSFAFIGLNVSKLKLSRDLLDAVLLKSQKQNAELRAGTPARLPVLMCCLHYMR